MTAPRDELPNVHEVWTFCTAMRSVQTFSTKGDDDGDCVTFGLRMREGESFDDARQAIIDRFPGLDAAKLIRIVEGEI